MAKKPRNKKIEATSTVDSMTLHLAAKVRSLELRLHALRFARSAVFLTFNDPQEGLGQDLELRLYRQLVEAKNDLLTISVFVETPALKRAIRKKVFRELIQHDLSLREWDSFEEELPAKIAAWKLALARELFAPEEITDLKDDIARMAAEYSWDEQQLTLQSGSVVPPEDEP